jgi:3-hydroxyisobutyrate dehydrogenase
MTVTHTQAMATGTVAVLGAGGTMGFPIARNLARGGIVVRAWNRSREKAEPLSRDGASGQTAR